MIRPDHLFINDTGDLYDTRINEWWNKPPLREKFDWHHKNIRNVSQLKATLRAGPHTRLGGYPLYFITSDYAVLSFKTVRAEFRIIANSIKNKINDGWNVCGCEINLEDKHLICDYSNERIK